MTAFSTAIRLASQVAGLEQTIQMRHSKLIVYISNLSTTAAAAAQSFGRYETAVEWLEQGRCLVWSQINNLRTPLDNLRDHSEDSKKLADRFLTVSRALEKSGSRPESRIPATEDNIRKKMSLQDEVQKHIKLARQWEELLQDIRSIDGFRDFLQPPSTSSLLSRIPKTGVVVIINVHLSRCDAIALLSGSKTVIHIPLDNLSYEKANYLKDLLHGTPKPRYRGDDKGEVDDTGEIEDTEEADDTGEVEDTEEADDTGEMNVRKGGQVPPKRGNLRKVLRELWLCVVKPILYQLATSVRGIFLLLRGETNYSLTNT